MCDCYICTYTGDIANIDLNKVKEIDINIQHNEDKFIEFVWYWNYFVIDWFKEILNLKIYRKAILRIKVNETYGECINRYDTYYINTNIDYDSVYIYIIKFFKVNDLIVAFENEKDIEYNENIYSFNNLANFLKNNFSKIDYGEIIKLSETIDIIEG